MESLSHVLAGEVTLALQGIAIVIVLGSARAVFGIMRGAFVSCPRAAVPPRDT
jgi:hypothetical protein